METAVLAAIEKTGRKIIIRLEKKIYGKEK
jgi:hypothetical protein